MLDNYPNSKRQIISSFTKYKLQEKDIFSLEESENMKLIHGLLSTDFFNSKDEFAVEYKESNEKILNQIKNRIDNYDIKYNEIQHFFQDKKSELAFKNRLLIIYLMDDELSNEKYLLIKECFQEVTEEINDLKLLIKDNNFFFKNSKNIDVNKVNQLIENIERNNLNYIKSNQEIKDYKNKIIEAKIRSSKQNSLIYMGIYNKEKEKENDDNKCLENSNNKFNQYKSYLTFININNIDPELKQIIQSLKLSEDAIKKEADNLMLLYNIEDKNEKKKIINSIICLSYKEAIIKLISSIKNIIEITKVKKEALSNLIETILLYLQKNEIVSTIQFCMKILKIYSINIFEENNFNKILIKFYGHPEYITFLFGITLEDIKKKREKITDNKLIENFNKIEKFVKILENKEEIAQMKDKDLIKKIREGINENYQINTGTNDELDLLGDIDDIINLQN